MLTGLHVLLVEDTPINAEVAGEILRSFGVSFDLAIDGVEAIEAVSRVAYALVLMDCQLPRVDGFEATRRIRALEASQALEGPAAPRTAPDPRSDGMFDARDHERAGSREWTASSPSRSTHGQLSSAIRKHVVRVTFLAIRVAPLSD